MYWIILFSIGVERFVKHLYKNNIPIAVATSSSRESYEVKVSKHLDFFEIFDHKVFGGSDPEVKKGKPDPEIFLVCASRFPDKPKPDQVSIFLFFYSIVSKNVYLVRISSLQI